jgi:hypothetical protein
MKTRKLAVLPVLFASLSLCAVCALAMDTLSGTWKLNPAKSEIHNSPPAGRTTEVIRAAKDGFKLTSDTITSNGQKSHTEFEVKFDGADYPIKTTVGGQPVSDGPDQVSAQKLDDYTFELRYKHMGKEVLHTKDVVSGDGAMLTVIHMVAAPQGYLAGDKFVYEKR